MSTRRSRIQVKPNIGGPRGQRGSAGQSKTSISEPVKQEVSRKKETADQHDTTETPNAKQDKALGIQPQPLSLGSETEQTPRPGQTPTGEKTPRPGQTPTGQQTPRAEQTPTGEKTPRAGQPVLTSTRGQKSLPAGVSPKTSDDSSRKDADGDSDRTRSSVVTPCGGQSKVVPALTRRSRIKPVVQVRRRPTATVRDKTQTDGQLSKPTGQDAESRTQVQADETTAKPLPEVITPDKTVCEKNKETVMCSSSETVLSRNTTINVSIACHRNNDSLPAPLTTHEAGTKPKVLDVDTSLTVAKPSSQSSDTAVSPSPGSGGGDRNITGVNKQKDVTSIRVETGEKDVLKPPLLRRRFAKAKPNLTEISKLRKRHASVSASDSEDDFRKQPAGVLKLASTSNTPSSSLLPVSHSTTCPISPVKQRCSATEDVTEDQTDLCCASSLEKSPIKSPEKTASRKRRTMQYITGPVDRAKLTMRDLIHMNPVANPMKSTIEEAIRKKQMKKEKKEAAADADDASSVTGSIVAELDTVTRQEEGPETSSVVEPEDEAMPVPQVRIGADGNIVISEESLVIEQNKDKDHEQNPVVFENDWTHHNSYNRKQGTKPWGLKETKKFFIALSSLGADFSLMCSLFPNRTRTELKKKYKREEKKRWYLVDMALEGKKDFDTSFFDELNLSGEEEEAKAKKSAKRGRLKKEPESKENKKESKRGRKKLKPGGIKEGNDVKSEPPDKPVKSKRKKKKIPGLLYDQSDSEGESQIETTQDGQPSVGDDDDDVRDDMEVIRVIQKPTRSGRTPKASKLFTPREPDRARTSEPTTEDSDRTEQVLTAGLHQPGKLQTGRRRKANVQPKIGNQSKRKKTTTVTCAESGEESLVREQMVDLFEPLVVNAPSSSLGGGESNEEENELDPSSILQGQLVFVTNSPAERSEGETQPPLIHVYMLSPTHNAPHLKSPTHPFPVNISQQDPYSNNPEDSRNAIMSPAGACARTPSRTVPNTASPVLHFDNSTAFDNDLADYLPGQRVSSNDGPRYSANERCRDVSQSSVEQASPSYNNLVIDEPYVSRVNRSNVSSASIEQTSYNDLVIDETCSSPGTVSYSVTSPGNWVRTETSPGNCVRTETSPGNCVRAMASPSSETGQSNVTGGSTFPSDHQIAATQNNFTQLRDNPMSASQRLSPVYHLTPTNTNRFGVTARHVTTPSGSHDDGETVVVDLTLPVVSDESVEGRSVTPLPVKLKPVPGDNDPNGHEILVITSPEHHATVEAETPAIKTLLVEITPKT